MKNQLPVFLLLMTLSAAASAQDLSKTCRDQMRMLSSLAGSWTGQAVSRQQGGVTVNIKQEETILFRLDSLVMQIEGIGRTSPDQVPPAFHALAFVSYNPSRQQFEMKSFLKDGKQTDAYFKVAGNNQFDWGFDTPGGKILYHITIDPVQHKWNETGKFSPDGIKWLPFFEMNLTRQ